MVKVDVSKYILVSRYCADTMNSCDADQAHIVLYLISLGMYRGSV
jgi:hypothetical protein